MKNWIIFNLVLLMTGVASAQTQVVAAQTAVAPSAELRLRTPASSKPVAKITNDDEIEGEMDAANDAAQATYKQRAEYYNSQHPQAPRATLRPVMRQAERQVQYRPVAQAAQPMAQPVAEGDYTPYKAPVRRTAVKPALRPRAQTQKVYQVANAEQARPQVVAPQAQQPKYQAQPIQLTPNPSPIEQYPENAPQGHIAEQDWYPIRRTGVTLLPTLNLGFGTTSADVITDSVTGASVSHPSKFVYGGGLMAEFGRSTFTFETGLLYITEQISSSYTSNYLQPTSDNATLGFVGVPILAKVNFSVVPHRSRLSFSGGVIPAVLIYNKFDYVTQSNGYQTDISNANDAGLGLGGFRTFNVFGTAAVGGDFTVGSQSDVRAEFAYRRALMSLTQNQNTFEDVFMVNLSFGFDVDLFSRSAPVQQYR